MSRNEMFLFLACAFALAVLASPPPSVHPARVTLVSLLSPADAGSANDPFLAEHGFDGQ